MHSWLEIYSRGPHTGVKWPCRKTFNSHRESLFWLRRSDDDRHAIERDVTGTPKDPGPVKYVQHRRYAIYGAGPSELHRRPHCAGCGSHTEFGRRLAWMPGSAHTRIWYWPTQGWQQLSCAAASSQCGTSAEAYTDLFWLPASLSVIHRNMECFEKKKSLIHLVGIIIMIIQITPSKGNIWPIVSAAHMYTTV